MGAATTCDGCAKIGPAPPVGWIIMAPVEHPTYSLLSSVLPQREAPEEARVFCSWPCVAEYAYLKAVEASMTPEAGETP